MVYLIKRFSEVDKEWTPFLPDFKLSVASNQSWEVVVSADTVERPFVNACCLSFAFKAVLLSFSCNFSRIFAR